jgi:multiple sugar transport system ATP-binding protein
MNDGRLQQVGTPLECYHEPNNTFVAGFIGEPMMNLVSGTRSGSTFVSDDFEYPLDDGLRAAVDDHEELILGIRPEDIVVREEVDGAEPDGTDFRFEVRVVEPHGDQNVLHLTRPGGDIDDALQAVTGGMHLLSQGEQVVVSIDPGKLHLFDAATGTALHNRRHEPESELTQIEQ